MAQAIKDSISGYLNAHPDQITVFKQEVDQLFPGNTAEQTPANEGLEKMMEGLAISRSAKLKRYEKGQNFSRFCERYKEFVQLTQMKAENQFSFFLQSVDDQTYALLKSVHVTDIQKQDIDSFCQLFIRAKYGEESFTLKNEVRDCKQSVDQKIEDYVYKLREKAIIAYTNPQEAEENCLLAFLRGVRNVDIKRKINEAMITSFADAIKLAKKLERVEGMFENEQSSSMQVLNAGANVTSIEEKSFDSSSRKTNADNFGERRSRYGRWDKPRHDRSRNYSSSRSRSRDRSRERRSNLRNRSPTPYRYRTRDNRRSERRSNSWRRDQNRSMSPRGRRNSSQNQRQYSRRNSRSPGRDQCFFCGERGHWRRDCPKAWVNRVRSQEPRKIDKNFA